MLRNTETSFGLVTKLFHWGLALYLLGMLGFGRYIATMDVGFDNLHLIGLHKAFGLLAFLLIIFRLAWRFISPVPGTLTKGTTPRELFLAHCTHMLLYAVMFAMPITGWIASSAAAIEITFFGLFKVPMLVSPSKTVEEIFFAIHGALAAFLVFLIIFHIAGALKRHFVLKDDTLRRMWF